MQTSKFPVSGKTVVKNKTKVCIMTVVMLLVSSLEGIILSKRLNTIFFRLVSKIQFTVFLQKDWNLVQPVYSRNVSLFCSFNLLRPVMWLHFFSMCSVTDEDLWELTLHLCCFHLKKQSVFNYSFTSGNFLNLHELPKCEISSFHILKGHSRAILVHFKNQKYVLTSMNAHK